ncbi:hypothetical protein QUF49_14285 [Fictibacillus sp. b24]|uniref:hypothetical protein n=1 Tax=Fictibacillus sp. b24 TaxID=3055863 RepID=UPI00259FF19B|nr:hypothetical protein [Fictibacillus sp. b24]MDM5317173.1 hypothetical protein [Fictibacillus sp. b24]
MDNKHQWDLNGLNTGDFQVSGGTPRYPDDQHAQDPRIFIPGCVIGICFNFCAGVCFGCGGCGGCGGCAGRCGGCGGCGGCAGRCGGCGGCGGRCGGPGR